MRLLRQFDSVQFFAFIIFGVFFSFFLFNSIQETKTINVVGEFILAIITYVVAHLLRIFRLYILFIEKRFSFMEILKIYVMTSWINFVIPFKIGELHRIAEYSRLCKSFKMGFISLWIERFFDSIILAMMIIFVSFNYQHFYSILFIFLLLFIAVSLFCYYSFPTSFRYTNLFLLSESSSSKGLYFLELLNSLKDYYDYAKRLLHGRFAILFGISSLIWILEILVYYMSVTSINENFSFQSINNLLNGLWNFNSHQPDSGYKYIVYLVLMISAVFVMFKVIPKRFKQFIENFKREKQTYYLENNVNRYRNY